MVMFDFAAAAPYVEIRMNGPDYEIDAIFISTHKFVGGPNTPGLLVCKRKLLGNMTPTLISSSSIYSYTPSHTYYDPEKKITEESGNLDTISSIRAGLVFQLKESISSEFIEHRER